MAVISLLAVVALTARAAVRQIVAILFMAKPDDFWFGQAE
jgi:hypothetical protein